MSVLIQQSLQQTNLAHDRLLTKQDSTVFLFVSQVISQFASVVTSTSTSTSSGSDTGGYPPSATTFAAGLGLSNIDLAAFVQVGCIFPVTSFYDKLVFKTVSPVVVISLLWSPTLLKYITRKESANSARTAARWSLFLLELIVSSVSTSVVQTMGGISPLSSRSRVMPRPSASFTRPTRAS